MVVPPTRTRSARCLLVGLAALLCGAAAAPAARAGQPLPTHIVFLRAMPAERAAALYAHVLGTLPGTRVVPGVDDNTLVVRDSASRLGHFQRLLEVLDVPTRAALHIYVRPVSHRPPSELAALIEQTLDPHPGPGMALIPDDILRVLVVQALPADYARIDRLARRLDSPAVERRRRTVVRPEEAP
ncbi:MAG: hypothetical protein H6744_07700 [Deltaproteobacteria bacterium]|nr:hypothetical protein [Deltaproteobacteria bacterium]